MIRASQTIGITGITKPVMRRNIAITTFSVRLDSCQTDRHVSSMACAVRWISPAIIGAEVIETENLMVGYVGDIET